MGRGVGRTIRALAGRGIPLAKKLMKRHINPSGGMMRGSPMNIVERGVRRKLNPKLASVGKIMRPSHALSYALSAARGKTRK